MNKMVRKFTNTFILVIFNSLVLLPFVSGAQQAMLSAGGNAIGTGGNLSYSIGQSIYITETGSDAYLSIGVIQPYEISVISGISKETGISLSCSIYPNPTSDHINLSIDARRINYKDLTFSLYNTEGALIETREINSSETQIEMRNYVSASYILRIREDNNEIKSFIVLKL